MTENTQANEDAGAQAEEFQPTVKTLRHTILMWEGLRILFNVVLLAEGALFSLSLIDTLGPAEYFASVIAYGVIANFCYCIGPLAELYAALLLRLDLGRFRLYLFAAGLLVSMIITAIGISVAKYSVPAG